MFFDSLTSTSFASSSSSILLLGLIGIIVLYALKVVLKKYASSQSTTSPTRAIILLAIIRPLLLTILCTVLILIINLLFPENGEFLNKILASTLLIIWCSSGIILSRQLIQRAVRNLSPKYATVSDATPLLSSLATVLILFIGCYLLFLVWGVNLTPLIALVGVIGTALSFAARDVVGNTLSGFSLFMTQPFKVGDYITIADDLQGKITEIGIQQTKLLTPQKTILVIPNGTMTTKPIENQSGGKSIYRFDLPFTVPQSTDIEALKAILLAAAQKTKLVAETPQPKLFIQQIEKDVLHLQWRATIHDPTKKAKLTNDLLEVVLATLPKSSPEAS